MNILKQMQLAQGLTVQEQAVAATILDDPERFLREGGKQLASRSYVSQATIYRLCSKLGCSGLSELKTRVSGALGTYRRENGSFDFNFPIKPNQSCAEVVRNMAEDYDQTLAATRNLLDVAELERCVEALRGAHVIDVYTSAGNVFFAANFRFQMREIGITVNVPVEEYEQRLTAASSDELHLAMIISFGGRGMLAGRLARLLHEKGVPILLIASADPTPIDDLATYRLRLCAQENHYHKVSSFATRLSLLHVLDVLYACYFEADYARLFARKMSYYQGILTASRSLPFQDERQRAAEEEAAELGKINLFE